MFYISKDAFLSCAVMETSRTSRSGNLLQVGSGLCIVVGGIFLEERAMEERGVWGNLFFFFFSRYFLAFDHVMGDVNHSVHFLVSVRVFVC